MLLLHKKQAQALKRSGRVSGCLALKTATINQIREGHYNVPRGFDLLLPFLEQDNHLRAHFFSELELVFYAAAALPQPLWDRFKKCTQLVAGKPPAMVSAWGSTETAPLATSVHYAIDQPGIIGLPAPGVRIKMKANAGKWELLVKGPNVTPGYFDAPELSPPHQKLERLTQAHQSSRLL